MSALRSDRKILPLISLTPDSNPVAHYSSRTPLHRGAGQDLSVFTSAAAHTIINSLILQTTASCQSLPAKAGVTRQVKGFGTFAEFLFPFCKHPMISDIQC